MIQEMYTEIQRQTDKHSVSELCSIYGVSRSGYYKWLKRAGQLNRYEKVAHVPGLLHTVHQYMQAHLEYGAVFLSQIPI